MIEKDVRYSNLSRRFDARATIFKDRNQITRVDLNRQSKSKNVIDDFDKKSEIFESTQSHLRTSSLTKKHRTTRYKNINRRFTINSLVTTNAKVVFIIIDEFFDSLVKYVIQNATKFKDQVVENSNQIFQIFQNLYEFYHTFHELCHELIDTQVVNKKQLKILERINETIREKNIDLKKNKFTFQKNVIKLRDLRNEHRDNVIKFKNQITNLRLKNDRLKKKVQKFMHKTQHEKRNYINDSNEKNQRRRRENITRDNVMSLFEMNCTQILFWNNLYDNRFNNDYFIDNFDASFTIRQIYDTRKHEKLSIFYDDHEKWKNWKNHLLSQVQIFSQNFFNEQIKINYTRNKIRKIAQNIIWFKVSIDNTHSYFYLKKLIQDLKNIYDENNDDIFNRHE